ncbi:hypothetical protein ACFSUS_24485 [Spirosoma soli]|uniref:DUF5683 domain-containing protein n=1 Tax=Spirosoma soli TaxID=1770529 RepID=A0ABW5ME25_9BACT
MRLLVAFFFAMLLTVSGHAQERVRNVRIRVLDQSQLEIRFDLINARPGDSVYLAVRSRLRGVLRISPEFVRGDIGKRITAGSDRRIIWDALANGYSLNEEIQATVLVKTGLPLGPPQYQTPEPTIATTPDAPVRKPDIATANPPTNRPIEQPKVSSPPAQQPTEPAPRTDTPPTQPAETPTPPLSADPTLPNVRSTRYAGPAWALVSAIAPGIGNIFVQTPRPVIGFRPMLTVATYGLIAYGLLERRKAQDDYAIYGEQKNATAAEPYYQTANDHHHRYWLATRGAVVIAAADVILTFLKGMRNQREPRQLQSVMIRPGIQAGQPTAVLRYSF